MNPTSFMKSIPHGSPSYQRRNPHLFRHCPPDRDDMFWREDQEARVAKPARPTKRIRQSSKPVFNKLEQEWYNQELDKLLRSNPGIGLVTMPRGQFVKFKLANGAWYSPDFFSFDYPAIGELNRPTAWEVKGPWFPDDAKVKLKSFAHQYPEIRVILAWKDKSGWQTQRILP